MLKQTERLNTTEIAPVLEALAAEEGTSSTPEPELQAVGGALRSQPTRARAEKQYRCLRKAIVRAGSELSSTKVGELRKGVVIETLDAQENENGLLRIRYADGWVSEKTARGQVVLEAVSAGAVFVEAAAEEAVASATPPSLAALPPFSFRN